MISDERIKEIKDNSYDATDGFCSISILDDLDELLAERKQLVKIADALEDSLLSQSCECDEDYDCDVCENWKVLNKWKENDN